MKNSKKSAFLKVLYNDIHGRENHLVKLDKMPEYKPPAKEDSPEPIQKKKESKKENKGSKKERCYKKRK